MYSADCKGAVGADIAGAGRRAKDRVHKARCQHQFHYHRLSAANSNPGHCCTERADLPEHRAEKNCCRDTTYQLSGKISRNTTPREIASDSEGQGDRGIQVSATHRTHEINDRHYHEPRRNDDHCQT